VSAFYDIQRTFAKVLDDAALGILTIQENQDFDPTKDGNPQWSELTLIPISNVSGNKARLAVDGGFDENEGIAQVSLFDKETGGGSKALLELADTIGGLFVHGDTHTLFNSVKVFIQQTDRNVGRIEDGYYQIDMSISWTSYVDR